jgi:hypothetical protein
MEGDGLLTADGTPPESDMLSKLPCTTTVQGLVRWDGERLVRKDPEVRVDRGSSYADCSPEGEDKDTEGAHYNDSIRASDSIA